MNWDECMVNYEEQVGKMPSQTNRGEDILTPGPEQWCIYVVKKKYPTAVSKVRMRT